MHRLRTVTSLDVSAVAGHHAMPAALLFSFQNNPKNLDPSLGLFRKGKTRINRKFHRIDSVSCSHSREGKTPSYSQINTVLSNLLIWSPLSFHFLEYLKCIACDSVFSSHLSHTASLVSH